jgi:hypothetical protein
MRLQGLIKTYDYDFYHDLSPCFCVWDRLSDNGIVRIFEVFET